MARLRIHTRGAHDELSGVVRPGPVPAPEPSAVRRGERPLGSAHLLQLQRAVGNRAVVGFVEGEARREPAVQRCRDVATEAGVRSVSSFDSSVVLNAPSENGLVGNGGALTVFHTGSSPFWHRNVCLEWYDGLHQRGMELAAHLKTDELAQGTAGDRLWKQVKSALPGGDRMKSHVEQYGARWDVNITAAKGNASRTVRLGEEQKEAKRQLLLGEIGKVYDYDLYNLGVFGDQRKEMNCDDWAKQVAPEAYV